MSSTSMQAVVPPAAGSGPIDVTVVKNGRTAVKVKAFEYQKQAPWWKRFFRAFF